MSVADWPDERLRDVQRGTYSTELAAEVIRLRGYQREAAHEMVQAAANLRNLTAMCEQHKAERDQFAGQVAALREALGSVRAGVWDRLYAKGPLSTEYAQAISREVDAALASSADAAEARDERIRAEERVKWGAELRQAALEEAIARFEERPPMPANQFRHEWAVDVLRALKVTP